MGGSSITHILILVLILLLFFGPSRLPALGQSLGKAIRGFKEGLSELDSEAKPVNPPADKTPEATVASEPVKETKKEPHS